MTTETQTWWVVQVLRKWESLQVLGLPLNARQNPGMMGFLPVFETLEQATAWRDEEHSTAGIVAIRQNQPGSE